MESALENVNRYDSATRRRFGFCIKLLIADRFIVVFVVGLPRNLGFEGEGGIWGNADGVECRIEL